MMRMNVLKYVTMMSAIAAFTNGASAQRHSNDSRTYFDYGNPVMTHVLQSPDGRTADVQVTTASSMFSYLRTKNPARGAYYAVRDVTVEVMEEGNAQPVLSRNEIDTLYVNTFDQSTSKTDWHAMSARLALPAFDAKKKYSLHIEVRDDIDRLALQQPTADLRTPQFSNAPTTSGIAIGDIALADSLNAATAYTSGRGNTYMFSRDVTGSVTFRVADSLHGDPEVEVSVRQISNLVDPSDTGARYHGLLDMGDLHRNSEFAYAGADSILRYKLVPSTDSQTWTALFTVPGQKFEQGKYEFSVRVRAGSAERTQSNDFQLVWQGMPLSLEDPADAIEPLQSILPPDQVKAMSSGTKQQMMRKLNAYWRGQDPTPGTAYNERMATFYQRVDYADFNFTTGHLLNGATTDRGNVYLLYGAPTKVERTFLPGETPTETWSYANNVGRIFRFEERGGVGEYRLTNIQETALAIRN